MGTLGTSDPDLGNTFTYSLVSGSGSTDNSSFSIVGNVLKTSAVFDFETKSSYSIRVRTTDQGGLWFEKSFTVLVTNVSEALVRTSVATFRGGYWYLDSNDSRSWNGVSGGDSLFGFGSATDIPITGDWNGDGQTDVGVFRGGKFYLDANGNRKWNNTTGGDAFFGFGAVTDIPVTGDWNDDGFFDVGVFRSGKFYLDANGNRKWDGVSGGDALFGFGSATDIPVTGDWNGDGQTDVGVFRKGTFYLDANGNRKWDGGFPNDSYFGFGSASDLPLTGDWNGDGKTDIGVYRSGKFYLDANGNRQWDGGFPNDTLFGFGGGSDIPVSGFWVNPLSSASSPPPQSLISDRLRALASAAPSSTSDVLGTTDFTRLRSKKSALIAQKHKGTSKLVSNRTLDEFFSGELTGIA